MHPENTSEKKTGGSELAVSVVVSKHRPQTHKGRKCRLATVKLLKSPAFSVVQAMNSDRLGKKIYYQPIGTRICITGRRFRVYSCTPRHERTEGRVVYK